MKTPDLTKQPPRSPRVRLGGYAILARCLDKGRAILVGKGGEYEFACGLDQQFLTFAGIDAEALKKEIAAGKGDGEILQWVQANAKNKHSATELAAWSAQQEVRGPGNPDGKAYFDKLKSQCAPHRTDIASWFELLDVDDYVSFGGKA